MRDLMTFDFEGAVVRTVLGADGEPWFVATDVCAALSIANNRDALRRIDDDEKGVGTTDTLGGDQQVVTVNESGLYSLILTSRKPEAKRFKKWVTSEVLPSIRKTGTYTMTPPARDPMEVLNDPAAMRGLLLGYTEKVIALEAKVEADAPKVDAYERLVEADGLVNRTNAAKALQVPPNEVFKFMRTNRWVYRRPGAKSDVAYQDKIEGGLLMHKTYVAKRDDGSEKLCEQVMVTPKGLTKLAEKLSGKGSLI